MTDSEKLEEIKSLLAKFVFEVDEEMQALAYNGDLEYWDSGNFDDAYNTGFDIGFDDAVLTINEAINQILSK